MDYVMLISTPGTTDIKAGIWSELKYIHGAAASVMEQAANDCLMHGAIPEALGIHDAIADLPKNVTQEIFEKTDAVQTVNFPHFIFSFTNLDNFKLLVEETKTQEDAPKIYVAYGGDHRKCTEGHCFKSPSQEEVDAGWVPWETEEVKES